MDAELFNYLATVMPAARVECAGCPREIEAAKVIIRDEQSFCSVECAEKKLALLIRPQPKGFRLEGWDL